MDLFFGCWLTVRLFSVIFEFGYRSEPRQHYGMLPIHILAHLTDGS